MSTTTYATTFTTNKSQLLKNDYIFNYTIMNDNLDHMESISNNTHHNLFKEEEEEEEYPIILILKITPFKNHFNLKIPIHARYHHPAYYATSSFLSPGPYTEFSIFEPIILNIKNEFISTDISNFKSWILPIANLNHFYFVHISTLSLILSSMLFLIYSLYSIPKHQQHQQHCIKHKFKLI